MANFGLNKLLEFSVPLLQIIYPVALVLIVMGISHDLINYSKLAYVSAAVVSVVLPFVEVLSKTFNINLGVLTSTFESLPLYEEGLSWLLPTLVVLVVTSLVSKLFEHSGETQLAR